MTGEYKKDERDDWRSAGIFDSADLAESAMTLEEYRRVREGKKEESDVS